MNCFFPQELKFIYSYVHYYMFIYDYYYPALGAVNISFHYALYHRHSIITIQFSHKYLHNSSCYTPFIIV